MSFQIGGAGPTYYKDGSMLSLTNGGAKAGTSTGANDFFSGGPGAQASIWADGANKQYETGDGTDLTKDAYTDLISHFGDIAKASGGANGGDGSTNITEGGLFDYAQNCGDPKTQRELILLMTNPNLLNQLDGADHNGLITQNDMQTHADGMKADTVKDGRDGKAFANNLNLIANDKAITFMDKFESFTGANGSNGAVGSRGIYALGTLADPKYADIFGSDSGKRDDAIKQWQQDRINDGTLPSSVNSNDINALFTGDGLLTASDAKNFAGAASYIYNGSADRPETQGTGPGSNYDRLKQLLAADNGDVTKQKLLDEFNKNGDKGATM